MCGQCPYKQPLKYNRFILNLIKRRDCINTYQGDATKDKFIDYLKDVLVTTLHDEDIVVMNNMRIHHSKSIKKVVEEYKINVLFFAAVQSRF